MVDDLASLGEQGGERVDVSGSDRGVEAGRVRGRGVRSHAARALLGARRHGGDRARWLGRQLVEAGERLGVAVGVEQLACASARPSAPKTTSTRNCLSKAPPLARSVPKFVQRTRNASGRRPRMSSTRSGDVVGDARAASGASAGTLRSARGPEPDGPVVDELDGGRERRRPAIERPAVPASPRPSAPSPRRGRAPGRREELGVALVQPGDGVAQPVGGEDLAPPASPLRVDLDQNDLARSRRRRHRTRRRRSRSPTSTGGRARASRRGSRAARAGASGPRRSAGTRARGERSLAVVTWRRWYGP